MNKMVAAIFIFLLVPTAVACDTPWQPCWYGQASAGNTCSGNIVLLSAYDAKQVLSAHPELRLPTQAELESFLSTEHAAKLRAHAENVETSRVLTSGFVQHGNEFLATTVDIRHGRVELSPWREPTLVILRQATMN